MFLKLLLVAVLVSASLAGLVIEKATRRIDVSKSVARHSTELVFDPTDAGFFYVSVSEQNDLAHLSVEQSGISLEIVKVETPQEYQSEKGIDFFKVTFAKPLSSASTVLLHQVFVNEYEPLPREVARHEHQLVVFEENLYFLSPYPVAAQTTVVQLASAKIEFNTKVEPMKADGGNITYGPFTDVEPFSENMGRFHFQHDGPLVRANWMKRILQASAWGVLSVEEWYQLEHVGAKLKGPFSRFEYQRYESPSVVPVVTAQLPGDAADIYYRDEIGNVSTSTVRPVSGDLTELDLQPRYPLFGGWIAEFYFGYNMPLSKVVESDGAIIFTPTYTLTFPLKSSLKDVHAKEVEIEIILPEGSRNIDVTINGQAPKDLKSTVTRTYLDTTGRPTFKFQAKDVVSPDDQQTITVVFKFSKTSMLQEPLLLTGAFFCFFIFTIFYARLV